MKQLLVQLNQFDQVSDSKNQQPHNHITTQLNIIRTHLEDKMNSIVMGLRTYEYMGFVASIEQNYVLTSKALKGIKTCTPHTLPDNSLLIGGVEAYRNCINLMDELTIVRCETKYLKGAQKLIIPKKFTKYLTFTVNDSISVELWKSTDFQS